MLQEDKNNEIFVGAQPITNRAQNVALSVNGEIYNHKELLEELKEIVPDIHNEFTTDSDCEVLLHLFQVYLVILNLKKFHDFYFQILP